MSGGGEAANVLVVFYSRCAATERLALAAGVGALQARANIRLRRIDSDDAEAPTAPECAVHLQRMRRDYVSPRSADSAWADVILLASPVDTPEAVVSYRAMLQESSMDSKIATLVHRDPAEALAFGRQATKIALARKKGSSLPTGS
jgi:hypothetical protein